MKRKESIKPILKINLEKILNSSSSVHNNTVRKLIKNG